jgi:hypothetical protein
MKPEQKTSRSVAGLLLSLAVAGAWAGTEGTSSTFYGQNAGTNNTGGANSGVGTFVGFNAGNGNTTGTYNTFLGSSSGRLNADGSHNTFVGSLAGYFNGSATDNTFIGSSSGTANTTGIENVFVGSNAGLLNSSGYDNAFVGKDAGYSNTNGNYNVFVGHDSGYTNAGGYENTFVGRGAGFYNVSGAHNTFVGYEAGHAATADENLAVGDSAGYVLSSGTGNVLIGTYAGGNSTTGSHNTLLGFRAGYTLTTGHDNVMLGYRAGYPETSGSNKLYIDNCQGGPPSCLGTPFIYGEFDNYLLNVNGVLNVAANGASKSQLHFSLANADSGGFLTSVLDNNFFMSSGARYDSGAGGWIQRSSDQQSVIQGSGTLGYRVFTSSGHAVGSSFVPTTRLLIDYNGLFALNANSTVAGHELHTSSGAYLTTSGTWTNASSREYKEAIAPLSADAAQQTLAALEPVTFRYKNEADQQRVGFIAEDVPELVAMKDRKGLSPMDIVAVLTKVVQQKIQVIDDQTRELRAERSRIDRMEKQLQQLAVEMEQLKAHGR